MISGINHITFAVTDLQKSIGFYTDLLGLKLIATWPKGAYLEAGQIWVALNLTTVKLCKSKSDDSHIAFHIDSNEFEMMIARLVESGIVSYRENTSEGSSYYFLDPDGHKLEIHSNTLQDRLKWAHENNWEGFKIL